MSGDSRSPPRANAVATYCACPFVFIYGVSNLSVPRGEVVFRYSPAGDCTSVDFSSYSLFYGFMVTEVGVIGAAMIGFMFFQFGCVCKEGAAVMVVACFHRDFCAPIVAYAGFGVFLMDCESGMTVKCVLAGGAMVASVVLSDLSFIIVCYVGELEFC